MTRVLPVLALLAALALAGCGSSATGAVAPAAPAVAVAKPKHVRTLPKKVFVRRVNAICKRSDSVDIGPVPTVTSDVARNRVVIGAWFGRVHREVRRLRLRFVRLGRPSRDRARWNRVMSKLKAMEGHLDTMRAAAWAGSVDMLLLSARELEATGKSANRRVRRFGAARCAG